jgi:hypothetical protein
MVNEQEGVGAEETMGPKELLVMLCVWAHTKQIKMH